MAKYKMHPNSLANLQHKGTFSKDNDIARQAALKSAESKRRNKAIREQLKVTAGEWKVYAEIRDEIPKALDVMKILMMRAADEGDMDTVAELAGKIAEFETPKLGRVEQTNIDLGAEDLSDEELDRKIQEFYNQRSAEDNSGDE